MKKNFVINSISDPDIPLESRVVLLKEDYINSNLQDFAETYDRASGVFYFSTKISTSNLEKSKFYFRGALGELISMEDSLKLYMGEKDQLRLYNINNTLLHVLRHVRNFQFHINIFEFDFVNHNSSIIQPHFKELNIENIISKEIIISDFNVSNLLKLKDIGNYYSIDELNHMVKWYSSSASQFNLQKHILCGLKFYCDEIVKYYGLN